MSVLAFLPSPSDNHWGPFHFYGLCIALGVFAAIEISAMRWRDRGGDPDDIWAIAIWAVPAGLIGARIYHLITDWKTYIPHNLSGMYKVWDGGLGIPGGILAGVLVGLWVARRRGMHLSIGLDAVAPAMLVAQAIGRWGNWFNQELFGWPTTLPWGLHISLIHRPAGYTQYATFQPTFLYEMLWNLALAGALILLDRRKAVRPGRIFALYIGGYAFGRFWVEDMRIDHASLILGYRINLWVAGLVVLGVIGFLALRGIRRRPGDAYEPYLDGHRFDDEAGEPDETSEPDESDEASEPAVADQPDQVEADPIDSGGQQGS
jgi:prolipoprotein diacylglyceryl transferase